MEIRSYLSMIVCPENANNWSIADNFERNVRSVLPAELEVAAPPPLPERNYNCFVYALGLETNADFIGVTNWEYARNLGALFLRLLQSDAERLGSPVPGCLCVYVADDGSLAHVGLVQDDGSVVSKWSLGPLIRHETWQVPSHYGNDVRFFSLGASFLQKVIKDRNGWAG